MLKDYIKILEKTKIFHSFNENDIEHIINCIMPRIYSFEKGEFIATTGKRCEGLGIMISGEALIYKDNEMGERIIMMKMNPGSVFGEMAAFSQKPIWPASIIAEKSCKIIFLSKEKIMGLCACVCYSHMLLIENIMTILSEKGLMLNQKVDYLSIKSIQGKISAFLLNQYRMTNNNNITLSLNRNELAEYLNLSRPSLSRELSAMKSNSIIDYYLNTFKLIDLQRLKELSIK